ncbi:MAG: phosphoglycerate dehydrogenase [Planctomycetia bacterium]|jgi:D-3-phosphoglycerate dehydrogenase
MPKILVTPRSLTSAGHPALDRLVQAGFEIVSGPAGRMPDADDLSRLLPGCVGWLAGVERINDDVLAAAPDLRVIARNGTGVDTIDLAAARRRGVEVRRAEGANARGVAELTIGLIIALARSIPCSDAAIKAGGWQRHQGIELEGRTLGIVGCGKIGRLVAGLARGLGMRVVGHDPFATADPELPLLPLDDLVAASDVITLHCPPATDGSPLLDARRLARVKPGMILVNTARHELVDVPALVAAIDGGLVAGAALDVFDTEPPTDRGYLASPRIIATPHVGGFTAESVGRAVDVAVDNLLDVLGRGPVPAKETIDS